MKMGFLSEIWNELEEAIIMLPELIMGLSFYFFIGTIILINIFCLRDGIKLYSESRKKGLEYGLFRCVFESYKSNLLSLIFSIR